MAGPGRQFPHDPFFFFFKLIVIGTLLKKKKTRKWGGVLILRCRINHQCRPDCEIRPPKQPSVDNVTIKAAAIDQQDPKMLLRSFIHRPIHKSEITRPHRSARPANERSVNGGVAGRWRCPQRHLAPAAATTFPFPPRFNENNWTGHLPI